MTPYDHCVLSLRGSPNPRLRGCLTANADHDALDLAEEACTDFVTAGHNFPQALRGTADALLEQYLAGVGRLVPGTG